MKKYNILIIRIVVAIILASVISVVFLKGIHPVKTPALAAGLLFFAYVFENTRNKK